MSTQEIVQYSKISLSFETSPLLANLSASIHRSEIVALVGPNGCGKSTLLSLLLPDRKAELASSGLTINGQVILSPDAAISHLPQNPRSDTSWIRPDSHLDRSPRLIDQLSAEFGFEIGTHEPEKLSDGQLQKWAVIATLSSPADLYLLDEPTNYLDIQGIVALEKGLDDCRRSGAGLLLITHDRTLTDNLADRTIYLTPNGIYQSAGGFESVWSLATGDVESRARQSHDINRRIEKLQEEVRRRSEWAANKESSKKGAGSAKPMIAKQAKMMARRSKSAQRRVEREIGLLEATKPFVPKRINLSFPPYEVRHRTAFTIEQLFFSYHSPDGDQPSLLEGIDLSADTRDKICLMGANGHGKTTLLKLVMGTLIPDIGTVRKHPNLKFSYLPQALTGYFKDGSLLDNFTGHGDLTKARQFLGSALIRKDSVEKHISSFSPGELMRAALVRAILDHSEFLLLDEPTSHLDIESIQVLEQLLEGFPGGYLMISHDRSFVSRTASTLYILEESRLKLA